MHNSRDFMYKERTLEKQVIELSKQFKVLLITGARQVGKSTLLKHCDKNRDYVTLDDYKARELAINEPELFLQRYKAPIIIDEIQYAPNLLSYIKITVFYILFKRITQVFFQIFFIIKYLAKCFIHRY